MNGWEYLNDDFRQRKVSGVWQFQARGSVSREWPPSSYPASGMAHSWAGDH